ncbi:MAG: GGDEF domain-containing protein [Gammaproteobacteria bacterium]|nr:GGDEF domain-containing protein [Gammaproteobacteria bacterium]
MLQERAASASPDQLLALVRECCELLAASDGASAGNSSHVSVYLALADALATTPAPTHLRTRIESLRAGIATLATTVDVAQSSRALAATLTEQLSASAAGAAPASIMEEFRHALLRMLDRLQMPPELQDRATLIRQTLNDEVTIERIHTALTAITELTQAARVQLSHELRETTDYLQRICQRLADVDIHISLARGLQSSRNEDCQALQRTIDESLSGARNSLRTCNDINELRDAIDSQISTISASFSQYITSESERQAQTETALHTLSGEMHELENETRQLRSDLEHQYARALVDTLTNVPNRLGYEERVNAEVNRWRRYGGHLSLAVIDVDHFKLINDNYGHVAGDRVLATVAERMRSRVRDSDHLCRFGGEEFVLILPETELVAATALVDQLRAAIQEMHFHYKGEPVGVTVSAGVAEFREGDTAATVFERADEVMYTAKEQGRNRCLPETPVEA